jgi:hypothetical protein
MNYILIIIQGIDYLNIIFQTYNIFKKSKINIILKMDMKYSAII